MQCNAMQCKAMQCNATPRNAMLCNARTCKGLPFAEAYQLSPKGTPIHKPNDCSYKVLLLQKRNPRLLVHNSIVRVTHRRAFEAATALTV